MITESDELAHALEDAGRLWPEIRGQRTALLKKIISAGIQSVESESEQLKSARLAALDKYSGAFTGLWPQGWHQNMVAEWPE